MNLDIENDSKVMAEHHIILISLNSIFDKHTDKHHAVFLKKITESFVEKSFGHQAYSSE